MQWNVMVVEDDMAFARVLDELFERAGCRVVLCGLPEEANTQALHREINLVSLDISMPGRDGFEVLSLIRSHEYSQRLLSKPVIAITGRASPEDRAAALSVGFAAHLGKPIRYEDIERVLAEVARLLPECGGMLVSEDHARVAERVESMLPEGAERLRTAAGLLLVLEQQARELLAEGLLHTYRGHRSGAVSSAERLARLAQAFHARRLGLLAAGLEREGLDPGEYERGVVLARAELDRVLHGLRDQVLS